MTPADAAMSHAAERRPAAECRAAAEHCPTADHGPAGARRVVASAPGKINLALAVGPLDADGYHPLATVFLALDLVETVEAVLPADDVPTADALTLAFDPDSEIDVAGLACDESNLAIRAARALAEHAGVEARAALRIRKRVPIAGGMGGGSADAAATLVACDALWGLETPREELHAIARTLGADVPFALDGGAAFGTGRGDRLEPVPAAGELHVLLVLDAEGMSTPATYRELDRLRETGELPTPVETSVASELLAALAAGDAEALAPRLANDLQAPAIRLRPRLAEAIADGVRYGALAGIVSGSGPTVALLAARRDEAQHLAAQLELDGRRVLLASGPAPGARILDAS